MRFYTTDQISPNRSLTPEGFLVCKDVAIGRTGEMLYGAAEVPVQAGPDGIIKITRDADAVFHEDTIASFQGKPITIDHPATDVGPANWSALTKGIVQHVRRGTGSSENLLLADLLITEATAIKAVRDGLRQVSSGYDADYEQIAPGQGRQRNIIGNHVALVEKGRCGERCAIGDKDMPAIAAKTKFKQTWLDKLRGAFKARDEGSLELVLSDEDAIDLAPAERLAAPTGEAVTAPEDAGGAGASGGTDMSAQITAILARLEALEARSAAPAAAAEPTVDKAPPAPAPVATADAIMPTAAQIQDVTSRAEILFPGITLPVHDSAVTASKVRDSLCALKRQALTRAYESESGRAAIKPFVGDAEPNFATMTCDALAIAFTGSSEIIKRENNITTTYSRDQIQRAQTVSNKIAEINKRNHEVWHRS